MLIGPCSLGQRTWPCLPPALKRRRTLQSHLPATCAQMLGEATGTQLPGPCDRHLAHWYSEGPGASELHSRGLHRPETHFSPHENLEHFWPLAFEDDVFLTVCPTDEKASGSGFKWGWSHKRTCDIFQSLELPKGHVPRPRLSMSLSQAVLLHCTLPSEWLPRMAAWRTGPWGHHLLCLLDNLRWSCAIRRLNFNLDGGILCCSPAV